MSFSASGEWGKHAPYEQDPIICPLLRATVSGPNGYKGGALLPLKGETGYIWYRIVRSRGVNKQRKTAMNMIEGN